MPRRLRLLWVTPFLPLRGVMAARERWWHLLARLATRHEITLLAFVDVEDAGRERELPPGLAGVHLVPKTASRPDDPLALLPRTVAGGFSNPAFRAAIAARLEATRHDVVQYEFSEMAHCVPSRGARSLLTVHQIGFAQEGPLWRTQPRGVRRAAVLLHRYLRELDFELRAIRRVDRVVTMSAEDAARLRRFASDLAVSVSPCGVDCAEFSPPAPAPPREVDLVFLGHFGHPPNIDAATFLVGDVLPQIGRPVRVRIIGRGTTPEVAALARADVVDVCGEVADVRPHLAAAAVVVAPVRFGTGMRGKVLEALAMGRPVVTTSVGAEGLDATPGRHLVVADTAVDFAAEVRRLLDDPPAAEALGARGRELVAARFDWDGVAAAHDAIYEQVLRDPPRAVVPAPADGTRLAAIVGRLGYLPALSTGTALLAARAVGWHLQRLRRPAAGTLSALPT